MDASKVVPDRANPTMNSGAISVDNVRADPRYFAPWPVRTIRIVANRMRKSMASDTLLM